jgi:hypothetical protein
MKKLFLIIIFTILGLITNAQTTLKGCMGINFGDSKSQVKAVMNTKKDFNPYKDESDGLSYTEGSFAGHEAVGAIFKFYQDKLHTIIILLEIKQEPKAMDFYYEVLNDLKDKYGVMYDKGHVYRSPYFAGDGYTVSGIKMGYIDIQSLFTFDDTNALAVSITSDISLKIVYQDGHLIDAAIEAEKNKQKQDY